LYPSESSRVLEGQRFSATTASVGKPQRGVPSHTLEDHRNGLLAATALHNGMYQSELDSQADSWFSSRGTLSRGSESASQKSGDPNHPLDSRFVYRESGGGDFARWSIETCSIILPTVFRLEGVLRPFSGGNGRGGCMATLPGNIKRRLISMISADACAVSDPLRILRL